MARLGTMAIRVRWTDLTDEHLHAASRLLERCYRFLGDAEDYTPTQLEELVLLRGSVEALRQQRDEYTFLLAWRGDALVGLVALRGAEITKLYVDPGVHRQGIGTALWRAAADRIGAAGHRELWLVTSGYGIPLYRSLGMVVTGTRQVGRGPLVGRTVTVLQGPTPRLPTGPPAP